MIKYVFPISLISILLAAPQALLAKGISITSGPLVDHPVLSPVDGRSTSSWNSGAGRWGENFAEETLRLRGFTDLHEVKHGSNNGIDRIAIKRIPSGEIADARFVEVKTSRTSKPKLAQTTYGGKQMSRKWLAANLRIMRNSGDPALKALALELSRFRKKLNVPIESMGEVIHINTKSGKLVGYAADGKTLRYSQSIERLLTNLQSKAGSKSVRIWATRTLSGLDQIRASGRSAWLGKSVAQQSRQSIVSNSGRNSQKARASQRILLKESRDKIATRLIQRSAGRIALFVAIAVDAKDIVDIEYAYQQGKISVRQRNAQLASTVGGMSGAFVGASAGSATGAWLGAFGGPFAWITVPAGGFLGGAVGGVGGYFGGSALASYGASAWYESIDASVRDKFELSLIHSNGAVQ